MNRIYMVALLVLIWCGFSNDFTMPNILLGLIFSALINYLVTRHAERIPPIRLPVLLMVLLTVLWELIKSSLLVAWDILTPRRDSKPELVSVPLACRNNLEIMLVANLLSLSPGTLSVDLTEDNTSLIVHLMFANKKVQQLAFVKKRLEPLVMKVFNHADPK